MVAAADSHTLKVSALLCAPTLQLPREVCRTAQTFRLHPDYPASVQPLLDPSDILSVFVLRNTFTFV